MLRTMLALAPLLVGGAFLAGAFDPGPAQGGGPAATADLVKCPALLNRLRGVTFGSLDAPEQDMPAIRAEVASITAELRSANCRALLPGSEQAAFDEILDGGVLANAADRPRAGNPVAPGAPDADTSEGAVSFEAGKPMVKIGN